MKNQDQECCPEFNKAKWEKKTFTWDNKLFIKESLPTFFHIPFPPMIGEKTMKLHRLAEKSNATIPDRTDALILFRDPSAFKSEIYYAVTREIKDGNNTSISGTFITRVFDGPYNRIPLYIREMGKYLKEKGQSAKDYYVHYAYCPECAKKSGHNYLILFAQV
jgi:hypothetical protein